MISLYPEGILYCAAMIDAGTRVRRTTISIDEHQYSQAKKKAKAPGISVAEFIRRSIQQVLPPAEDKPWMRHAGFVESGNPRSNQSIDEIVHGSND